MKCGVAHQPFAERDPWHFHLLAVFDRQLHFQLVVVVHEQDAERAVIDHPLGELRDPREQLVDVEHRGHLVADLGEGLERLRVQTALFEQARVHQRDRHVSRELGDDRDVVFGELPAIAAEDVQRADRPRLVPERHHHLGSHAGHELDVARIGRDVVHEQRCFAGDRGADQTDPRTQPDRLFRFRVPDGVRQPQLPPPFVEQVHRERLERDQPADQLRDLTQQLVEIENRRNLAAEVEEGGDELALARGGKAGRRGRRAVRCVSVTH